MSSWYFLQTPKLMKFLVIVNFYKHSLHFLIPLPCTRYPSSLTKQNYFSELPDLHNSRYVYISILIQIKTALLKSISQTTLFSLLCFTLQSSLQVHEADFFWIKLGQRMSFRCTFYMLQPLTGIQPQNQMRSSLK